MVYITRELFYEYSIYLLIVSDTIHAVYVALVYFEIENKIVAVAESPFWMNPLKDPMGGIQRNGPGLDEPRLIPGSPAGAAAPLHGRREGPRCLSYILHDGKLKMVASGAIKRNHHLNMRARFETFMQPTEHSNPGIVPSLRSCFCL